MRRAGEINEARWYRDIAAVIVPACLAGDTPVAQSGSSAEDGSQWAYRRDLITDAVDRDGAFLDVGFGPRRFLHYLRQHGHAGALAGLDRSPAMLTEARALISAVPAVALVRDVADALRDDLLRAFALPVQGRVGVSFRRDNGTSLLAGAFSHVEETLLTNALVFRQSEAVAAYVATMFPSWDLPEGSDLPGRMYVWPVAEADRRLSAEGVVWCDSKAVVISRCHRT